MNDDLDQDQRLQGTLQKIRFFLERGNLEGAKTEVSTGLKESPNNEELIYYSAYVDFAENNHASAEQTLARLLELQPDDYDARGLLADIYQAQNKYVEAEQLLIGILKDYPEDVNAYVDYAWVMLETLNVEKAFKLSQEALKRAPEHSRAMQVSVFSSMVLNGVNEDTHARLQKLCEEYPDTTATCMTMVATLIREGKMAEAKEISQEVLRLNPNNQDILEAVKELNLVNHWSMRPLRPLMKYGWGASIAIWVAAGVGFRVIDKTPLAPYSGFLLVLLLAFVVYSWVWPSILRKIILR